MSTERRYDLDPLLNAAGLTRRQLRTELRISGSSFAQLEDEGLTDEQADLYAIRLGLWPWKIWPTWLDDGLNADAAGEGVPPVRSSCEQP